MKLSQHGVNMLKNAEGLRLKAYLDTGGVPTIGYGNTQYENGTKVKLGDVITRTRAESLFTLISDAFAKGVEVLIKAHVTQNQFDALVNFAYNVGLPAFTGSTLLKRVNSNPNDPDIAYQFSRWNKDNGVVNKVLTRRRLEESELYFL